jgi:ATP-dependent phosphoenolpyruvate carboxykinase
MMIRDTDANLAEAFSKRIDFTVMNSGEFPADPSTEGVTSNTSVCVNFKEKEAAVLGS